MYTLLLILFYIRLSMLLDPIAIFNFKHLKIFKDHKIGDSASLHLVVRCGCSVNNGNNNNNNNNNNCFNLLPDRTFLVTCFNSY
jgi:hypothetical protein